MKLAWISSQKKAFPQSVMCQIFKISPSGLKKYIEEQPTRTEKVLMEIAIVRKVHDEHRGVNGSRRNSAALKQSGYDFSRRKTRRLMKAGDMESKHPKPYRVTTKQGKGENTEDLILRDFTAKYPNQKWVTDITYIRTKEGWLYLCVMLDLHSRKVTGWSIGRSLKVELVLEALEKANRNRRPKPGLIIHSDHGSQYTSKKFKEALEKKKYKSSMGKVGNCWDNAVAETFFSTLKKESDYQDLYEDRGTAIADVAEYIEYYYNEVRMHSYLGYQSPSRFEDNQSGLALAA